MVIWATIVNKSFLSKVARGLEKYTGKDKKYMTRAIPVTINKFGPSGSSKNTNIILEQTIDVIPKIRNCFFICCGRLVRS